jgi:nitrile hydratase accessory protein
MQGPIFDPRDPGTAPVFQEPWQAHAFALAVCLHQKGVFTWPEWADALARQITQAQAQGDLDDGSTYYHHWLAALEGLVTAKQVTNEADLARYVQAWDRACDRTPHGQPIHLHPDDFNGI